MGDATSTMSNSTIPRRRLRRHIPVLAAAVAIVLSSLGGLSSWSPVGGSAPAAAEPVPADDPGVARYFGRGAYEGIRAAVAATPRSCDLSDDTLTALVMAPIFKEVSMAETPDAAPSPMTLSRWDEWTGKVSGSNNLNANYGLYPHRDPHGTPYKRAFWTPGIGIFQYDVAGVGAPFTAAELVNVEFVARTVAAGMADRYCAAGGDSAARRAAAWAPWAGLNGVAKSEALFHEMAGLNKVPFGTIGLVDEIENTGGMEARTCEIAGEPVDCHYIDPARAQGANWWATDDPSGGAVGSGMAPLTAPFYVVKRGGKEERHWMRQDTGYPVDIQARRALGQNARPMDGEPGSGLEWFEHSELCDTERSGMGCEPEPASEAEAEPEADDADDARADDAGDAKDADADSGEADDAGADDAGADPDASGANGGADGSDGADRDEETDEGKGARGGSADPGDAAPLASLWAEVAAMVTAPANDAAEGGDREEPPTHRPLLARGLSLVPPASR